MDAVTAGGTGRDDGGVVGACNCSGAIGGLVGAASCESTADMGSADGGFAGADGGLVGSAGGGLAGANDGIAACCGTKGGNNGSNDVLTTGGFPRGVDSIELGGDTSFGVTAGITMGGSRIF